MTKRFLVRREDGSDWILLLTQWSLLSLFSTRLFLKLTNNPQISFGEWHIAHVLWGGLLMLVGIIMLVAYQGNKAKRNAIILSGVGWGLFIDEIGKFLTRDNDYWFKPAIIFIYISFVILVLLYRYLKNSLPQDNDTLLYGVLNKTEEIFESDFEKREKRLLLARLDKIIRTEKRPETKKLAVNLRAFVSTIRPVDDKNTKDINEMWIGFKQLVFQRIFKRKIVLLGLWTFTIYFAVDKLIDTVRIATSPQKMAMLERFYKNYDLIGRSDVYMLVLKIVFDVISAIFLLIGSSYFMTKRRLLGIRYFQYGLLVSVLLSSVFKFYFEQFRGVFELGLSIFVLELLREYRVELSIKKQK